jgi:hypothetical protein
LQQDVPEYSHRIEFEALDLLLRPTIESPDLGDHKEPPNEALSFLFPNIDFDLQELKVSRVICEQLFDSEFEVLR